MAAHQRSPYPLLEASQKQFRLLRLQEPESGSNHIRCELHAFSLLQSDLPPWKALSYRWGEDEPEYAVELCLPARKDSGTPLDRICYSLLPVRKDLHSFLTQMIAERREDWFFIDAICVDQSSESEKTFQVQQMSDIYRLAEEVVAWIVFEPSAFCSQQDYHDAFALKLRSRLEQAVLHNSYWTRLWIVQEVLLAKRLTIRIGDAEIEWSNLIPDRTFGEPRGVPTRNRNLSMPEPTAYNIRMTALQILSYRRYQTRSLRAGSHLPFHRAFDFFSMQNCGRAHDKVFGYLGLTNSRIQVDYSLSILDLFTAVLADYLLSAGLITEDLTPIRKRLQFMRQYSTITMANDLIAPLLAFDLDPFHPVVALIFRQVAKFFVPGFEDDLLINVQTTCWALSRGNVYGEDLNTFINGDHKCEIMYIGSVCVKFVKYVVSEGSAYKALRKEITAQHKALAQEDAMMKAPGDSIESKRHSEWVLHAKSISERMWQRFQESGEDTEGDMDDEAWTLIA